MGHKKILISLPESLLSEADRYAASENMSRSEWIRSAMQTCIKERRRKIIEGQLKQGYIAMGAINTNLAEESLMADNEQLLTYERKLSESE
ncbi:MAG: CopG family transcriptional regulator [Bacillota bacterium]|nr:CopG family transcriptional regulator [Bacillota bacterium]